jgi:hypothetical protein
VTLLELLRRRAADYETLAEWHAERAAAGAPRHGAAADACVAIAIVLREVAQAVEDGRLEAA